MKAITKTRQLLVEHARWVKPSSILKVVIEDPDDDKILEAAVEAKANAIITYDPHLLKRMHFQKIQILTPEEFERENQI